MIDTEFGLKNGARTASYADVLEALEAAVQSIPKKKKLCIIFDEIEYISPLSPTDPHWNSDFIDFWQALWTIQSRCEKVSYIVCGVNPTICEVDRFPSAVVADRTVQNPIFGIFNLNYLKGLSLESTTNMLKFFGSRMGMFFSSDAIDYLHEEYGGHPLLTRLACSYHHEQLLGLTADRPAHLRRTDMLSVFEARDAELSSYCGHVISEIAELYKEEYELLKLLASGEIASFYDAALKHEHIRHIRDYGLVEATPSNVPKFKIPVVKRYLEYAERLPILLEEANRYSSDEGRRSWLQRRSRSVADDILLLDSELRGSGTGAFYSSAMSFKAHQFVDMFLVQNEGDAISFLVHAHKYLVEPADKHLKGGVARNEDFGSRHPRLREAFMYLKSCRNMHCHVDISGDTESGYRKFLVEHFKGKEVGTSEGDWFRLQRILLDHIHVALQTEIARI